MTSALVRDAVRAALQRIDARARVVVGFSGGVDSTVLLDALVQCRPAAGVLAWHVDHGLQPAADQWSVHCERAARALGVPFGVTRLDARPPGTNLEAWARAGRYQALWAAVARFGAAALLVAHHADDQVETVLMRLARGSGPAALAGMPSARRHGAGWLLRPLLPLGRDCIVACARERGLAWVEDPMNDDPDRLRTLLRTRIVPELARVVPGLRGNVLRSAQWLRESGETLLALAERDLRAAGIEPGARAIERVALAKLPAARRDAAARAWIASLGAPVPGRAALAQWAATMLAGTSAHALFVHAGWQFRRYRNRIEASPQADDERGAPDECRFRWCGEAQIAQPSWGGTLTFAATPATTEPFMPGVSWLRSRPLALRAARGTDRLRLQANGRSRSLKNLFQEHGVAPHLRRRWPVLHAGDKVLFVAGFGADRTPGRGEDEAGRVAIGWRFGDERDPWSSIGASPAAGSGSLV